MRQKFGSTPGDHDLCNAFVAAGCSGSDVEAAINMGLNWSQFIMLGFKYGQMVVSLIGELASLIETKNLSAASIQSLVQRYGPQVEAMIREILGLIGVGYPQ